MKKLLLWGGIGFAVLILIIIVVTLVSRSKKATPKTSATGPITLNFWDPIDQPTVFKDIIDQYQTENPNVKINYVPKPLQDYELESSNAILAGNGPDIWALPNSTVLRHLDQLSPSAEGFFKKNKADTTTNSQGVKQNFPPIVAQENIHNDKLYGLPLYVDTLALYINPQLFSARVRELDNSNTKYNGDLFYTGPKTWNDLVDLVKLYTQKQGDVVTRSAIALGRADNVDNSQDILAALMLQNGAVMADAKGLTATFNLPSAKQTDAKYFPGTKALEFFSSFSDPKSPNYTWASNFPSSYLAFRDGQTAMMINYSSAIGRLKQESPNLSYKAIALPQISGATKAVDFAKYWTLTVPKASQHTAQAWSFIHYLQNQGLGSYLGNTNLPNPHISPSLPTTIFERAQFGSPFRFQNITAASWYRGQDPDKVEAVFRDMITQMNNHTASPQNIIDKAASSVTEIFRNRQGFSTLSDPTPQKATQ